MEKEKRKCPECGNDGAKLKSIPCIQRKSSLEPIHKDPYEVSYFCYDCSYTWKELIC